MPDRHAVVAALAKGLSRYRYVLAVTSTVLVLLALLPDGTPGSNEATGDPRPGSGFITIEPEPEHNRRPGPRARSVQPTRPGVTAPAATPGEAAPAMEPAPTTTTTLVAGAAAPATLLPSPECDPGTGRLAVPTRYAPPCVPSVSTNGGPSYQGVSDGDVTVAVYLNRLNPATRALLTAAGFDDTTEDVKATHQSYLEYFEGHYQTWGRQVRLEFVTPSGADDDAATARADAVRVATELKAFASLGGPSGTTAYADELAARKVLCICTAAQPADYYQARAPYVLSPQMSSTQAYLHRAEYIGKRLAGRAAEHAGEVLLTQQPRRFGLLYADGAQESQRAAVDFFERELARYGVALAERLDFTGADTHPTATQEQAGALIARLKASGVTSVIYVGDPLSPVFFTQEATRQRYGPEWIVTGSASTDTTFFARTYDQTQWAHAFGLSFLPVRTPLEETDAWTLHAWHHGRGPAARATHGSIYLTQWMLFTGMHLGGPVLSPQSIRDGLFRFPPTGHGSVTGPHLSFGRQGVWPFEDHTGVDDATEIWWDPTTPGPDEAGQQGLGMYRYVDGGRRYLPGGHPPSDSPAFQREGTVTMYPQRPPSDRPPSYARRP